MNKYDEWGQQLQDIYRHMEADIVFYFPEDNEQYESHQRLLYLLQNLIVTFREFAQRQNRFLIEKTIAILGGLSDEEMKIVIEMRKNESDKH